MQHFTSDQLTQAKSTSIVEILAKNGFNAVRQDSKAFWYLSPLRSEKTASFAVYKNNSFYDFGQDLGGDVILLTQKLLNINFVTTVNMLLDTPNISFVSPQTLKPKNTTITIESVKPLKNKFFVEYIKNRKISIAVAETYLSEVYYKVKDDQKKPYFGIGMQNASNGYEIKNIHLNKYFCLGAKDISIIDNGYIDTFVVFEGMFDFLAFLTYYDKPIKSNVIILHSVANVSKVINHLPKDAKQVFLFLDNDKAGQTTTDELSNHFKNFALVKDKRNIFAGYKDFAEFLEKTTNQA